MHITILVVLWLFLLLLPAFDVRESPVISDELAIFVYIAVFFPVVNYFTRIGWHARLAAQRLKMCDARRVLIGQFVHVYLAFGATWLGLVVLSLARYLFRRFD